MMTSSAPISIPASEPISTSHKHNDGLAYSSRSNSSDDEEGRCGASGLSAMLGNSDAMGELEVGSLPMHLQRPVRGGMSHNNRTTNSSYSMRFAGPMSLPQPNAPFLSSREGPKDKLSSIPDFTLPESAVATGPESLPSVQYGSLRESRNHFDHYLQRREKATTHHQSTWTNSLPAYSHTNFGGRSVGLLSPTSGASSQPQDEVEEISERCTEITLGEGCNDSHEGGVIIGSQADFNHGAISESPLLSSSLTALDVLTRIRGSQVTLATAAPAGSNYSQPIESQQPHASFIQSQNAGGDTDGYNNNDWDANPGTFEANGYNLDAQDVNPDTFEGDGNPDMFEAFDFELDG